MDYTQPSGNKTTSSQRLWSATRNGITATEVQQVYSKWAENYAQVIVKYNAIVNVKCMSEECNVNRNRRT